MWNSGIPVCKGRYTLYSSKYTNENRISLRDTWRIELKILETRSFANYNSFRYWKKNLLRRTCVSVQWSILFAQKSPMKILKPKKKAFSSFVVPNYQHQYYCGLYWQTTAKFRCHSIVSMRFMSWWLIVFGWLSGFLIIKICFEIRAVLIYLFEESDDHAVPVTKIQKVPVSYRWP